MKNYKFVGRYMSDLELEELYSKYLMAGIPEIRWPLLIIDEVYKKIRVRSNCSARDISSWVLDIIFHGEFVLQKFK